MRHTQTLWSWLTWIALSLVLPMVTSAAVIEVGPGRSYTKPSDAAKVAKDGDIIAIDAGTYRHNAAVWRQHNLTIRGIGGRAHLKADGVAAEGKAIWVIEGDNTTIENIEFSGARVRDRNGAGIRLEGAGLTIRRCYFHDNEMGILTGKNPTSDIVIEYSEFANNGFEYDDAYRDAGHNLYIGQVRSFTLRHSYVHHAKIGHNVKSRARENYILYNRLMDEQTGTSSYIVDISNGGTSYLIGNLIQQGPKNDNSTLVAYATEGEINPSRGFYIVNNTFVNNDRSGTYIENFSKQTPAKLVNNIFASVGDTILNGPGELVNNLITDAPGFVDATKFDYRLTASSPAIDAGTNPNSINGFALLPRWHYQHLAGRAERRITDAIDIGAYEFSRN